MYDSTVNEMIFVDNIYDDLNDNNMKQENIVSIDDNNDDEDNDNDKDKTNMRVDDLMAEAENVIKNAKKGNTLRGKLEKWKSHSNPTPNNANNSSNSKKNDNNNNNNNNNNNSNNDSAHPRMTAGNEGETTDRGTIAITAPTTPTLVWFFLCFFKKNCCILKNVFGGKNTD